MTKICRDCGHKKGDHKFYKMANDPDINPCCCWHKDEDKKDICGCEEFIILQRGEQNGN